MLAVPPQIILNRVTSSAMTQDFGGCQVWLPHVAESEMSMISHGMVHLAPARWLHHQALREVLVHTSTSAHRHLPLISPFGLAQVSSAWTCSVAFLLEGGKEGNLQSKEVPYVIFLSLMAVASMWILTVRENNDMQSGGASDPAGLCVSIVRQSKQWDSHHRILTWLLPLGQFNLGFSNPWPWQGRVAVVEGTIVRHSWVGAWMCCYSPQKEADSSGCQCIPQL